jgi:probable phosphoglycerate mutase
MKLYLIRHGNTFAPGDPIVWVGKKNNLPLVDKGVEQAENLAKELQAKGIQPSVIYCSSLLRTKQFAEILIDKMKLDLKPQIDDRLTEIDYGDWNGLTSDQVVHKFGQEVIDEWTNRSRWPRGCNWGGTEPKTVAEIFSFINDITTIYGGKRCILAITSNGRLRYFLKLIPRAFEQHINNRAFKVNTGHVCRIDYHDAIFSLKFWNAAPAEIY